MDLDPQQQMVSEIWGMQVRVVNASLLTVMQGGFRPAAFVNLWQKQVTGVFMDQQFGACYQSVLDGVEWAAGSGSELLDAIAAASERGLLSIEFNVFGYGRDSDTCRGTDGPYRGHHRTVYGR